MTEALNYIWYIFDKLINWFFNDTVLFEGVTIGWVIVVITVFGLLIRSLLNVPRGAQRISADRFTRNKDN